MGKHTWAMATYSTPTDAKFRPKTVQIATGVEKLSTKEMKTGAISLQKRSIRLMEAFNSAVTKVRQSRNV